LVEISCVQEEKLILKIAETVKNGCIVSNTAWWKCSLFHYGLLTSACFKHAKELIIIGTLFNVYLIIIIIINAGYVSNMKKLLTT